MIDKEISRMKPIQRKVYEYFLITIAVSLLAIAISVLYQPNELVTGGVSGIGIMVEDLTGGKITVSITNLLLNIPLVFLGFKIKGKDFIYKTLYATVVVSLAISLARFIPPVPQMDDFLAAVFGGAITGIGLGIVVRCNSTTGGTDLAAILLQHYYRHLPVPNIIFAIEFVIIIMGMFLYGPVKGMYAIIAIYAQTKLMDITISGLSTLKAAFVITSEADKIGQAIVAEIGRSATIMDSMGAYTKTKNNVLLCALPSKKIIELRELVAREDAKAFVIVADVREIYGEGYKDHFIDTF